MSGVHIQQPIIRYWRCPNCPYHTADAMSPDKVVTKMHSCPAKKGLTTPLVECDDRGEPLQDVKITYVRPEDYIGDRVGVSTDENGKPVMGVITERPDGSNDARVFATTPVMKGEAHNS